MDKKIKAGLSINRLGSFCEAEGDQRPFGCVLIKMPFSPARFFLASTFVSEIERAAFTVFIDFGESFFLVAIVKSFKFIVAYSVLRIFGFVLSLYE